MEDLNIPVALVSGSVDECATPYSVDWLNQQIGVNGTNQVVFNQEYPMGHLSFTLAKDMSWLIDDVMPVIE